MRGSIVKMGARYEHWRWEREERSRRLCERVGARAVLPRASVASALCAGLRPTLARTSRTSLSPGLLLALSSRTMSTPSSVPTQRGPDGRGTGHVRSLGLHSPGPPCRLGLPIRDRFLTLSSNSVHIPGRRSLRLLGHSRLLACRTFARLATRAASKALAASSLRVGHPVSRARNGE
jgi:hypothetical protein